MNKAEIYAALTATLAKWADREVVREDLTQGETYTVELHITGQVNGRAIDQSLAGELAVGHAQTVTQSTAVDSVRLLAYLLERVRGGWRAAIARLQRTWADHGNQFPETSADLLEHCEQVLRQLRGTKQTERSPTLSFRQATATE